MDHAVAALRSLPYGGIDESTRDFALPPAVRAATAPAILALRWGAVGYGLVFAAPAAFNGSYSPVLALAVCLFITTWRTVLPIRLASTHPLAQAQAIGDIVLIAVTIGFAGGLDSPFIFCLLAAVFVAAFGWGIALGGGGLLIGFACLGIGQLLSGRPIRELVDGQRDLGIVLVLVLATFAAWFVRARLLDSEERRLRLAGEVESLTDANDLLTMLNSVARTLPTSLTLKEALDGTRRQIADTFDARVVCLLAYDDNAQEWIPKLAQGCVLHPAYERFDLPEPLSSALDSAEPILRDDLTTGHETISPGSGSGLYVRLRARDSIVGVLGLEHPTIDQYTERDAALVVGLAEVLALTIDNARWFGRLRSLGAEEERVRLARDLHDRLGQWLTYIGFELERIMGQTPVEGGELDRLYSDVQAALDELRETLRQLRSGVTDTLPLADMGRDLVTRFADRADVDVEFNVSNPGNRLPVPVENELYRIMQEALNNVDKHARATVVRVNWTVDGGNFELSIADDGRGFDVARGVRDSAYGLVGMRERADVIGARLVVESTPGVGTTVRVVAGSGPVGSTSAVGVPMRET